MVPVVGMQNSNVLGMSPIPQRQKALGIIGVLASALLTPGTAGGAATTSPLGELIPIIGSIPGLAPIMMPISLALTAWGLLGKIDKYVRAAKQ